jgi:hypothetical protein
MTTYRITTEPMYAAGRWHTKYSAYRKWLRFWFYVENCGFMNTPEEAESTLRAKLEGRRCKPKKTVVKTMEIS